MNSTTVSYVDLVNMLLQNITPEYRAIILNKLVTYNNQLLAQANMSPIQIDPTRSSLLNARKKDVSELQHPSIYGNQDQRNNVPLSLPIRANNNFPSQKEEIDINDIIDDIIDDNHNSHSDDKKLDLLDAKLRKLDILHKKIIADKKRRKNRNSSSQL
jgi:hypothetical protein